MQIKDFIEKAIEGGWKSELQDGNTDEEGNAYFNEGLHHFKLSEVLLDPKAWQAVSKVEGWKDINGCGIDEPKWSTKEWLGYMHNMIDALAEGKTIEQYIDIL